MLNLKLKSFYVFLTFFCSTFFIFSANVAWAGDGSKIHWVSPTGSATWANCEKATDPGTNYCSLNTALSSAQAGETTYLKGGNYDRGDVQFGTGFAPANSGNCPTAKCLGGAGANRISFLAAKTETPIIYKSGITYGMMGVNLHSKNWIRISGLTFKNFTWYTALIDGTSSYNEIDHCAFINDPGYEAGSWFSLGGYDANYGATNNWIHHNYFSKRQSGNPCGEAADLVRIGNAQGPPTSIDNFNTFENNYLEYAGHATLFTTAKYLVIKNNIAHNEPWISGCVNYLSTTTASDLQSLTTGSKTFHLAPGLNWPQFGNPVIFETSNFDNAMKGSAVSYDSVTGILKMNITSVLGSGSYSDWTISFKNVPRYINSSYNGLFGHRNFAIGDQDHANDNNVLIEGNRIGFASVNPGNGGSTNLDMESPGNIARYNYIYGGMSSGIYMKWANGNLQTGGVRNHVFNNTVYKNGYGWDYVYGGMNVSYSGRGIAQFNYSSGATLNIIKNNLVYGNRGDICGVGLNSSCSPQTYDTVENNWCSNSSSGCTNFGDPHFANPDLSNPLGQNLFPSIHGYAASPLPDLSLTSNSIGVIDGGASLTQTKESGIDSKILSVADAKFFQDGTWGSDLARGVTFFPDWIAIGAISNVAQINSIDYANNIINLKSPISWSANAPVWLYKDSSGKQVLYGSAPDYGAYEYSQATDTTPPAAPAGIKIT